MPITEGTFSEQVRETRVREELAFRRRVLRFIGVTVGAVAVIVGLLWHFILRPHPPATLVLTDCTKPWSYTYPGSRFQDESLHVHIRGHIAGHASLRASTYPKYVEQSSPETLGPGEVDYTYSALEWWCESCALLYTPTDVTSGHLEITIRLQ